MEEKTTGERAQMARKEKGYKKAINTAPDRTCSRVRKKKKRGEGGSHRRCKKKKKKEKGIRERQAKKSGKGRGADRCSKVFLCEKLPRGGYL